MAIKWLQYHRKIRLMIASLIIAISLSLTLYVLYGMATVSKPVTLPAASYRGNIEKLLPNWKNIKNNENLQTKEQNEPQGLVRIKPQITVLDMLRAGILLLTGVDIRDLRSLFKIEIPVISLIRSDPSGINMINIPNFPKFDPGLSLTRTSGKPLVGIYHTHTSESFIPDSGTTHKRGGKPGDIVEVGRVLANRLDKYGIKTVHSANIHDYPSFMKAYGPSEETAKKMLRENPTIQMIFDIHRDAEKRENAIATINGAETARIAIVVATGREDLLQPHWQQNYAFAKLIDAKLNQHFPGLSRGIQLVDWRYNQHLHPRALLLEVGSQETTKLEAERSIEMFGDVLAQIITENNGYTN